MRVKEPSRRTHIAVPSLLTVALTQSPVPGMYVCSVHEMPLSSETYTLPPLSAASITLPSPDEAMLLQVWLPAGDPGLCVKVWPCVGMNV